MNLPEIDPKEYYAKYLKGKYMLEEESITFNTLEEWYSYPYKYDIMKQTFEFREYLRNISKPRWYNKHSELGMYPKRVCTPFFKSKFSIYIGEYINYYKKIARTDLEKRILEELKSIQYSKNVFCHNALYYKSFIVKDNKLVGIRNWEYAGYYPPEFEDIISRYLEYLTF
jgi:thiamine kinase-like enzyme